MTEQVQTESTAPAQPLSRRDKLVEAYNKLSVQRATAIKRADDLAVKMTELAAEVTNIDALASIKEGSEVVITVGKGEAAKEVVGTVLATRDDEDGSRSYKVQHGTGFDVDVTVVKSSKVKLPSASPSAAE